MSNTTVSRNKYESIKRKADQWRTKALEAFEEIQELRDELERSDNNIGVDFNTHNNIIMERDNLLEEISTMRFSIKEEAFKHERVLIKKDAEIDRLKMSLNNYKERYQEIREDYKDLKIASR